MNNINPSVYIQLGALMSQSGLNAVGGTAPMASTSQIPQPAQQPPAQQSIALPQSVPDLFSILGLTQSGSSSSVSFSGVLNSAVVGSCPTDDDLIISALRDSGAKGWTYRQALENLHGVHNHTASQWKDYYLDHAHRINDLLLHRNSERIVAKKPDIDSISRNGTSNDHGTQSASPVRIKHERLHPVDRERTESRVRIKLERTDKAKGKARASRTPSPPRRPVKRGNKYMFTDEDREWFVRYVNYRLKEDPNLKKLDLCAEAGKKAPHHSSNSWLSHWSQQRDYYDARIPRYHDHPSRVEPATDSSSSSSEDDGEENDNNASEYTSSRSDSTEDTDSEEDIKRMSGAGETLNNADRRVIARWIASHGAEWDNMSFNDRWDPIAKLYPQRNAKAWGQIVSNHSKAIHILAREYRRRNDARTSVLSQRAVPSWAKKPVSSGGLKRVRTRDAEDGQSSKRTRDESSS